MKLEKYIAYAVVMVAFCPVWANADISECYELCGEIYDDAIATCCEAEEGQAACENGAITTLKDCIWACDRVVSLYEAIQLTGERASHEF